MLIIANWKAYIGDIEKAKKLVAVSKRLASASTNNIVIAPPAPLLGTIAPNNKSKIAFAAQDISAATGGALTGESTASAYAAVGVTYAIIGHSERRALGDTNAVVSEKLVRAFTQGLIPILCVGEHERDSEGRYLNYIREELTSALTPLMPKERSRVIVAYEPLWAIGKTAAAAIDPNDLAEMALYVRKVLADLLPGRNASHAQVLYGGSVEPENIRSLAASSSVDGFLIGRASTDPAVFAELIKQLD